LPDVEKEELWEYMRLKRARLADRKENVHRPPVLDALSIRGCER